MCRCGVSADGFGRLHQKLIQRDSWNAHLCIASFRRMDCCHVPPQRLSAQAHPARAEPSGSSPHCRRSQRTRQPARLVIQPSPT